VPVLLRRPRWSCENLQLVWQDIAMSSVQSSVFSDLNSVFSEQSEATEVGDVPAVAPDIQQLLYVEVHL
jgi:hypothetical protein